MNKKHYYPYPNAPKVVIKICRCCQKEFTSSTARKRVHCSNECRLIYNMHLRNERTPETDDSKLVKDRDRNVKWPAHTNFSDN